jgi:hypothetical protein
MPTLNDSGVGTWFFGICIVSLAGGKTNISRIGSP